MLGRAEFGNYDAELAKQDPEDPETIDHWPEYVAPDLEEPTGPTIGN